ncbi:MAG: DNA polymerase IV [Lewinellaceae bacterium]|nr:DNA polymerase IV [Lewinellaceae bacterium]
MFERSILHLDMDTFFVSVERLRNSALLGKPIIIGGHSDRAVVASCSYEARTFGVRSAMPVKMALRLCPEALVLRGDMDAYNQHSKMVTEIIKEEAPLFEKSSIDEFYLDLTGMDRYVGCWKWSKELREKLIRETGLPMSSGLSANKLVSKISTGEAKPNGTKLIELGTEKHFLDPLSIRKIPSIGQVTYKKLRFMGVKDIRTLRHIPQALLQREFGQHGLSLWKKANGIDNSPVIPYREKKSISSERTFHEDTIDVRFLKSKLTALVMNLAYELRQSSRLTACIAVKIRYSDFNTYSKQKHIPYTASDQALIRFAQELFDSLYNRRQLVRLIGVRFSKLVYGHQQMELFTDMEEDGRLLKVMDDLRKRFGMGAVKRGSF